MHHDLKGRVVATSIKTKDTFQSDVFRTAHCCLNPTVIPSPLSNVMRNLCPVGNRRSTCCRQRHQVMADFVVNGQFLAERCLWVQPTISGRLTGRKHVHVTETLRKTPGIFRRRRGSPTRARHQSQMNGNAARAAPLLGFTSESCCRCGRAVS